MFSPELSSFHPLGQGVAKPAGNRLRGRGLRVALYSHDTQGLGHIRRNILIAKALSRGGPTPVVMLLSGVREAAAFAMPDGVDCLTLPSISKDTHGAYRPRSLVISMEELIEIRRRTIAAALSSFDPDVFIVDKVPLGAFDELVPGLRMLRARGRTRLVLGLREILDDPEVVQREWEAGRYAAAIRKSYHRIWVYGDRDVFDLVAAYGLSADIAAKVRFTGYLNPRDVDLPSEGPFELPPPCLSGSRVVLCVVGGGRDGLPLARAFLGASMPAETSALLVTGPLMPESERQELRLIAAHRPRTAVLEFVTDPSGLMQRAERIIAMGGYNTMCEVLAYGRPALIVPRTRPRTEQLIRAQRMEEMGLVQMLHPDRLSAAALERWITDDSPPMQGSRINMQGVRRLPELLNELVPVGHTAGRSGHEVG